VSKKKKGLFSWLGFGQDKKEQATPDNSQAVEESAPEAELIADTEQSEAVVEDVVIAEPVTSPAIPQDMVPEVAPEAELSAPIDELEEQETPTARITEPEVEQEPELSAPIDEPEEQEAPTTEINEPEEQLVAEVKKPEKAVKLGFFARLKQGLTKTRKNLGGGLFDLFRGKQIDDELFEELETHL
jgi:fused signal recognition particle receptor